VFRQGPKNVVLCGNLMPMSGVLHHGSRARMIRIESNHIVDQNNENDDDDDDDGDDCDDDDDDDDGMFILFFNTDD